MATRRIEDLLRAEYFDLLPEARLVTQELETRVRHAVLSLSLSLSPYERLRTTSRVKECQSAIDALRRRQEGATFDTANPGQYSLRDLKDLAAVRLLVFPRGRMSELDGVLRAAFSDWEADPITDKDTGALLAYKYFGYCGSSEAVRGEFQIVPLLTGLFWEVEHSALYKPTPELKGIARSLEMRECISGVLESLQSFEDRFELLVKQAIEPD